MTNDLTQADKQDLRKLEQQVQRGVTGFREAGAALQEIRDRDLWRGDHPSFEAYCQSRWGFKANYARRIINAAKVVESVPNGTEITTEGEARRAIAQQRQATADEHGDILSDDPDEDAGEWDDGPEIEPEETDLPDEDDGADSAGCSRHEEPTPYDQFEERLDGFCRAQMRNIDDLTWPLMCGVMDTASQEWHSRGDA